MATPTIRTHQPLRPHQPTAARTAILASADASFRERVREALTGLRWQVREASGGAEALAFLDSSPAETVILDSWLPDLEIGEFIAEFERLHPTVDLISADGIAVSHRHLSRSPRRNEILYALRRVQDADGPTWNFEAVAGARAVEAPVAVDGAIWNSAPVLGESAKPKPHAAGQKHAEGQKAVTVQPALRLPELIGSNPAMIEVSRRVRLVAARTTPVLIEGPTGTGKELVARAIHRLSPRAARSFVALNCAAIPEALLEAELFGHTRGAFTGAVQGRVGRIEAAHGGTLFLDEIGEMPLPLQAKMLRFLECGELQRVGENEPVRVDVRIVSATHRKLHELAARSAFRADLYYRLAVFLIRTPSLSEHPEDIPQLVEHFTARMALESPAKSITAGAMRRFQEHAWPGNVRELEHTLERAWILAEDRNHVDPEDVEFGENLLAAH